MNVPYLFTTCRRNGADSYDYGIGLSFFLKIKWEIGPNEPFPLVFAKLEPSLIDYSDFLT